MPGANIEPDGQPDRHRIQAQRDLAHFGLDLAKLATEDGRPESVAAVVSGTRTRLDVLERDGVVTRTPLFDPGSIRFARFIGKEPPPRRWILTNMLPASIVGVLASMGGAGKSFAVYQLAISICSGLAFLGIEVGKPGSVLYLAGEDGENELHRRGLSILDHMAGMPGWEPWHREAVAERLHVVSRVSQNNLLTTAMGDGEVRRTPLVERLSEAACKIPDLKMIFVDPTSRFRGGRANVEEDATRFAEACEAIVHNTGAGVLCTAHISQSGIREGGGQEIVRGSTAMVDAMRWVATLQRLRRDKAGDYGLHAEKADRYLRLEVPKSNYAPPFPGLWLRREAGGVMVPCDLEENKESVRERRDEHSYLDVVERIQVLLSERSPMTRCALRDFAGTSGVLGAGDKTVRSVVERAGRDGSLIDRDGLLHPPSDGVP